ncbi:C2H2 zinc finger [Fusarium beomiforme]|uniref:C2H2 zinc finger n=1 Tax=Fusarium beomiforme TaxID=44412 RepID=A0A9P5DS59_9HYPO|nr:C2H2 zinc finger [Fusarium beomiforme]
MRRATRFGHELVLTIFFSERHKARHASKDRLAGGLGLGILRTKRHRRGRLVMPRSPQSTGAIASATITGQFIDGNTTPLVSDMKAIKGSNESTVGTLDTSQPSETNQSASFPDTASADLYRGMLDGDGLDFIELGDMYHDSNFDFMHFNVTGGVESPTDFRGSTLVSAQDGLSILPSDSFHSIDNQLSPAPIMDAITPNSPMVRTPTASQSPEPFQDSDPSSTEAWSRGENGKSSSAEDVDSLCSLGRLGLNNLHLTETKRGEILSLVSDMRPVYPDGTLIDESTANLSLVQMQGYLDLFFSNFNSCYPMIHSPTIELLDAEPLFLLSLIVLGATYKEKEDHQLSVCLYDAMMPYIMSGLNVITVPDLSILQTFMILECYGMYRAGSYQRENAILMHTFLFNVSPPSDFGLLDG